MPGRREHLDQFGILTAIIALGILRTKMLLGDLENVALGGSQRAAYHIIEVMCCLTNRA